MRTVHGITPHGPCAAPHLLSGPLAVTEGRPRAESISLHKLSAAPLPHRALQSHARACFREHRNAISFRRSGQPTPSRSTTKRRDRPDPSRCECMRLKSARTAPLRAGRGDVQLSTLKLRVRGHRAQARPCFGRPVRCMHAVPMRCQVCTTRASSQLTTKAS